MLDRSLRGHSRRKKFKSPKSAGVPGATLNIGIIAAKPPRALGRSPNSLRTPGPFGLATRALRAHPPNWIQTNLAPRGETKPVDLIESCTQGVGARPQTPGRRRRKKAPQQHSCGEVAPGFGAEPQPPRPPPPAGYGICTGCLKPIRKT